MASEEVGDRLEADDTDGEEHGLETAEQLFGSEKISSDTVVSILECPVCMLAPRSGPIYQCPIGHLVCKECQPSLSKCPICGAKYKLKTLTRNFFAESVLDLLERKCRYELFGCSFFTKASDELLSHEENCDKKPCVPLRRKVSRSVEDGHNENNNNEIANIDEEDEEEEVDEEEEEEDDENVIEVEDIFVSNFAFVVVLLRAYILEFASPGRVAGSQGNGYFFEYFLLFLLCVWLYHVWAENGFHILMDETSPYIAGWFAVIVLTLMVLKSCYGSLPVIEGEGEEAVISDLRLQGVINIVKPLLTFSTGLFCCFIHAWVYDLREESKFVLGCVMSVSLVLSMVEVFWNVQSQMDQFYYVIFWLQSFFIVLPFGMIGRHFLEF